MPVRPAKCLPRHRGASPERGLKDAFRRSVSYCGVAAAATGMAVGGGVALHEGGAADTDTAAAVVATGQAGPGVAIRVAARDREPRTTRSQIRPAPEKARREQARREKRTEAREARARAGRTRALAAQNPRLVARRLMGEYGLSESEFGCLNALWVSESDWDPTADNPTSSAYGIPQALTGGTHKLPADYMTNPVTQIRWGLWYIRDSYGTACSAWRFKRANNWY